MIIYWGCMLQLEKNRKRLVLVVDDSNSFRTMLSELLYVRQFRVVNASDGQTALGIIANHPEISIVITDFEMPGIDGCTLCRKIRETRSHDDITIIGMSSIDDKTIGARFQKSGADDFMSKNKLQVEEFYSRVDRCAKMMNLVAQAKNSAERDFLTGLYNRRYFFDAGTILLEKQKRQGEKWVKVSLFL